MQSLIKRTIIFFFALLSLILILVELSEFYINKKSNFRLTDSPKYIVFGHSHSECSINDSLIEGLKNLSKSGESYFYTYFKVKKTIEQNPSVKIIFIEFTNGQLNESQNDWIWGKRYMNEFYPIFSPFMSTVDKMILLKNNHNNYFNAVSIALKANFKKIIM